MDLTLFMIITPRDFCIARYSLSALRKAVSKLQKVKVIVYLNGVFELEETELIDSINHKTDGAFLVKSNRDRLSNKERNITNDEKYMTEWSSTIWSRELVLIDSQLIGIIDADFEVFDPSFIEDIRNGFVMDEKLGIFSTEHSETVETFDTYSQQQIFLMERYHTWFCVYRKAALEDCHDFEFHAAPDYKKGLPIFYDHSAFLQKELRERGWHARHLEKTDSWKYLHYGAFAKNLDLSGAWLPLYRLGKICKYNGFYPIHHNRLLARIFKKFGAISYDLFRFGKLDSNRGRYPKDQKKLTTT
jgi:hypothetical protein